MIQRQYWHSCTTSRSSAKLLKSLADYQHSHYLFWKYHAIHISRTCRAIVLKCNMYRIIAVFFPHCHSPATLSSSFTNTVGFFISNQRSTYDRLVYYTHDSRHICWLLPFWKRITICMTCISVTDFRGICKFSHYFSARQWILSWVIILTKFYV